jgi:hypothetical protein
MNTDSEGRLSAFFEAYEKAIQPDSNADLCGFYHQSFLFAGPKGAQPVKLEDFARFVPKMSADARARGLASTTLKSHEIVPLDNLYSLARVIWDITFRQGGKPDHHIDTRATYILMRVESSFRIVAQIDHQDLSRIA